MWGSLHGVAVSRNLASNPNAAAAHLPPTAAAAASVGRGKAGTSSGSSNSSLTDPAEIANQLNGGLGAYAHVDYAIKVLLESKNNPNYVEINLSPDLIRRILKEARDVFMSQPMLLEIDAPVNICGDIHGQYSDLLSLFDISGYPPHANYLFLGDYVDRAQRSVEVMMLLLCYKLRYPENVFLLRGNHECSSLNRIYGFYDECKRRYSVKVWKCFVDCFKCLPVAAVVADKIFCTHGGLSPDLEHVSQINEITRPDNIPPEGLMCDLLWSDPSEDFYAIKWSPSTRGVSYHFSTDAVNEFLDNHGFELICRGHQVVEDGYKFFANRRLVTVFSAPNYCGEFDNAGAVLVVDENLRCSFKVLRPAWHKWATTNRNSVSLASAIKSSKATAVSIDAAKANAEALGEESSDTNTSTDTSVADSSASVVMMPNPAALQPASSRPATPMAGRGRKDSPAPDTSPDRGGSAVDGVEVSAHPSIPTSNAGARLVSNDPSSSQTAQCPLTIPKGMSAHAATLVTHSTSSASTVSDISSSPPSKHQVPPPPPASLSRGGTG